MSNPARPVNPFIEQVKTHKDSLYQLFNLPARAALTVDSISRLFYERMKQYHPAIIGVYGPSQEDIQTSKNMIEVLGIAFSVLCSPEKKQLYDQSGFLPPNYVEALNIDWLCLSLGMWAGLNCRDPTNPLLAGLNDIFPAMVCDLPRTTLQPPPAQAPVQAQQAQAPSPAPPSPPVAQFPSPAAQSHASTASRSHFTGDSSSTAQSTDPFSSASAPSGPSDGSIGSKSRSSSSSGSLPPGPPFTDRTMPLAMWSSAKSSLPWTSSRIGATQMGANTTAGGPSATGSVRSFGSSSSSAQFTNSTSTLTTTRSPASEDASFVPASGAQGVFSTASTLSGLPSSFNGSTGSTSSTSNSASGQTSPYNPPPNVNDVSQLVRKRPSPPARDSARRVGQIYEATVRFMQDDVARGGSPSSSSSGSYDSRQGSSASSSMARVIDDSDEDMDDVDSHTSMTDSDDASFIDDMYNVELPPHQMTRRSKGRLGSHVLTPGKNDMEVLLNLIEERQQRRGRELVRHWDTAIAMLNPSRKRREPTEEEFQRAQAIVDSRRDTNRRQKNNKRKTWLEKGQ